MNILITGAGPAGLYLAYLLKRQDAGHRIRIVEQNPPDATFGFGVVFSDRALDFLRDDDEDTHALIVPAMRRWTDLTLVHRGPRLADSIKYWILPDIENRIREGSIPARFDTRVVEIGERGVTVEGPAGRDELPAQAVFLLTGYHPDAALLREAGVNVDPDTLVPEHDPATLQTNVPGLYVAGAAASGRFTSRIFIENGRFHGEAILRDILNAGGRTP